jgi:hypothetical protein
VVHDREVVRGEVPDHVHVVLEEAEIDAHRVVVEQITQVWWSTRVCLL